MSAGAWPGRRSTPLVASLVVLILLAAALGVALFQSSSAATGLSSQLSSTRSELSTAEASVLALGANVSSLQSIVAADNAKIASDQSQAASLQTSISADTAKIANLTSMLASSAAQVSALQNAATTEMASITSLNAQVSTLQSQANALQSQVGTLQSQIAALQSQVGTLQSIAVLSSSTVELSKSQVSESAGSLKQISQFTANYAGYLLVTGNATTQNGYIAVDTVYPNQLQSQAGQSVNFMWGANGNYVTIIPVLPGTVVAYLGNYDTSGTDKATVTLTYYY